MIIAVDADGTLLHTPNWPEIESVDVGMIMKLKELQAAGHRLILWTCRKEVDLLDAVYILHEHELDFDSVNCNLDGYNSRKIVADVYIDDRALSPADFMSLPESTLRRVYGGNTTE